MLRTTLAGLRAHKLRLVATALAIVLGVGFVAGTLIFGDTAKSALFDEFARGARHVDAVVEPAATPAKSDRHPPTLPLSTVDTVRAVPGVSQVDGRMQEYLPLLDKHGRLVGNSEDPGVGLSAGTVPALRLFDVTAGRAPAASGEAALDADTIARTHYAIGDTITVLDTHQGRHPLTLVGIVSFGTTKAFSDQAVVVLTRDQLTTLTDARGYHQVVVTATAGLSQTQLVARIAPALPGTAVIPGDEYRVALANSAVNQVNPFLTILLVFAIVACVVAAFVIYNTFTILVAQRVRELALLRMVGAVRGQVFGSVLLESAIVGLLGAVLGIGLGLAVAYGLFSGASALGAPLPAHALVLTPTPVLVALALGLVVTVCSAVVPAIRATRVSPLAALRANPLGRIRSVRGRIVLVVLAVLVGALGTFLTLAGSGTRNDPKSATLLVLAGGIVNFLAVLLLSPLFVGPLTAVLGWLPGRLFGTPAKLASANARRNPGRAAATTSALMIGVGLMSAASVAVATVQVTAIRQITGHYPVDYILQPAPTGQPEVGIPAVVAEQLRSQHSLALVAQVRITPAAGLSTVNGTRLIVGAMDPSGVAGLPAPELSSGRFADFRDGTAVLFADAARGHRVGDRVTLNTDHHSATFTVIGIAAGTSLSGDVQVTWHDFGTLRPDITVDDLVMVKAVPGVSPADSRAAVEAVTDDYPLVSVQSLASWRSRISNAVDQIIAVVAALLAIAILIALIGIMNTLSLSVFERTRESATLRALGLTRAQLRGTLLVEALLMGVVGALVGVSFGVLYGWATTRVMFSGVHPIVTIPVGQLVGYVALAALAGVVAAVLPARRAGRASIVAAMADS